MEGLLHEQLITVDTGAGRIHGMLHLPAERGAPAPAVMLMHGFTASSTSDNRFLVRQARHLAAAGIAALRFDFRGSGQSEGQFHEMTLSGQIDDAMAMFDWLGRRPEIDRERLGLHGFSMGGAIAGSLLGQRRDIQAAVLWAPVAHPLAVMARGATPEQFAAAARSGIADAGGEGLGAAFIAELPAIQPLAALSGHVVPLCVIHGSADETVAPSEGESFFALAAGEREMVYVEGANHTFTTIPWREQVWETTTAWFVRHL